MSRMCVSVNCSHQNLYTRLLFDCFSSLYRVIEAKQSTIDGRTREIEKVLRYHVAI